MSLRITRNGLLDTIQDGGRYGYQHLGINPGGVMDGIAMQAANALVGNDPEEAVLEMHFPAAEIVFETMVLIALSGADFCAQVNGKNIPSLHPVMIPAGAVLKFTKKQTGARAYMSVYGGFVTNKWLNSSGTNIKAGAGGYKGRALKKNDKILLKKKTTSSFLKNDQLAEIFPWRVRVWDLYRQNNFRFVAGNEYDLLTEAAKQQLTTATFTIGRESDRMGYRLEGEQLQTVVSKELISTAVTPGTMQLLPGGEIIILMAEHQTTGGYPRIGHIISADIASLAQMNAGEKFSFEKADQATAEKYFLEQQANLQQLYDACNFRLQERLQKTPNP